MDIGNLSPEDLAALKEQMIAMGEVVAAPDKPQDVCDAGYPGCQGRNEAQQVADPLTLDNPEPTPIFICRKCYEERCMKI